MIDKPLFAVFVLRECFTTFFGEHFHYPYEIISLIIKRVFDTDRILEIKISHITEFQNLVEMLRKWTPMCYFRIDSQKKVIISSLSCNLITEIKLIPDACYYRVSNFRIVINLEELRGKLLTLYAQNLLTLYVCNDSRHTLRVHFNRDRF